MAIETMTLVISVSAVVVTALFVAKLVKAAIQLAVVVGLLYACYHFYPQIQKSACEKVPELASPIGICIP